ncbi:MAG: hypothetical protein HC840_19440 [Leptolyngbyaceae cyanobacterium RM2_2_4]|nr:hypothetical protein [Leptolyngbyaceae cyanobacterium SM1_4_3]NJN92502.1 hypothetical protein [Leptolyngbyaceae cyanobacterium SL_5_14]NJO51254.1 hypothetical protein [Leptolyngbyaceae cyanobacterium RM2_2_4]
MVEEINQIELNRIGFDSAEQEIEDLPAYYFDNDYYQKASSFSRKHVEFFFIGRTGSGKSAILEMVRQKKEDSLRVVNVTEEDFAVQLLLSSPAVSNIPSQYRELAFKTLWKYVIIVNILKVLYGDRFKWSNLIHGENREAYLLLNKFGELAKEQKTFTDQVFSFLQRIQEISIANIGGIKKQPVDSRNELYELFKILNDFEREGLAEHLSKKYVYILIDDLDKNWTGSKDNVDLVRCLFECIIQLGTKFYGNVKFVVALRTDIFRQLDFRQTEKIRPYVTEINWYDHQLRRIIELRLTSYWKCSLEKALSRFPNTVKNEDTFDFFIRRTMKRPRDIINFVNSCIEEANKRSAHYVSIQSVLATEKKYSRDRMVALIDEWKFVYPDLELWIESFAGRKFTINYSELEKIFEHENRPIKEIIDSLYEVGFIGYYSPEDERVNFSFFSTGKPGFDHTYHVHVAFFSYLDERAEALGRARHSRKNQESQAKQLREDMLDLFGRVLSDFPESVSVSSLKAVILEQAPEFDERKLGYRNFEEFLKDVSELVTLYVAKGITYVKTREIGDDPEQLSLAKEQEPKLCIDPLKLADAFDLVKQVLNAYPNGLTVAHLKHLMLQVDSTFDERSLGYNKFLKFLESAPEIVVLYKTKGAVYAKLIDYR